MNYLETMQTVQLFGFPSYTDNMNCDEFHKTLQVTISESAVRRLSTVTARVPSQVGFVLMKWH
jgi:hypothetical protein